jgi:hypothetical protein
MKARVYHYPTLSTKLKIVKARGKENIALVPIRAGL